MLTLLKAAGGLGRLHVDASGAKPSAAASSEKLELYLKVLY